MGKVRRRCPHCERTVGTRLVAGSLVVAAHDRPRGGLCPGTGLAVGPAVPARPGAAARKQGKKTRSGKATAVSGGARVSARERDVIRASERRERAERDAAFRGELGGSRSVRSVSGGLPTLGRGR